MFHKTILAAFLSLFLMACPAYLTPTPLLMGDLVEQNDEVVELYSDCSTGPNYTPDIEGCKEDKLLVETKETLELAKEFISADIKQPQGYDIYLSTSLVYFRIAESVKRKDYKEAEQIARQFLEIQKARQGDAITDARFYLAATCSARASWQWFNNKSSLDSDRKTELIDCLAEAREARDDVEGAHRRVRLLQYINTLERLISQIDSV